MQIYNRLNLEKVTLNQLPLIKSHRKNIVYTKPIRNKTKDNNIYLSEYSKNDFYNIIFIMKK